ncbi:hypothetical protein LX36DRAFT_260751 [Colletotrichum falcatum]|nr:hypothetical protein LX36DRAFT_260751 [Colletotrichum falcatum]
MLRCRQRVVHFLPPLCDLACARRVPGNRPTKRCGLCCGGSREPSGMPERACYSIKVYRQARGSCINHIYVMARPRLHTRLPDNQPLPNGSQGHFFIIIIVYVVTRALWMRLRSRFANATSPPGYIRPGPPFDFGPARASTELHRAFPRSILDRPWPNIGVFLFVQTKSCHDITRLSHSLQVSRISTAPLLSSHHKFRDIASSCRSISNHHMQATRADDVSLPENLHMWS